MLIKEVPIFKDNYIWLIMDNQVKHPHPLSFSRLQDKDANGVIAVDPGEASVLQQFLDRASLHLDAIWVTHHHWDHTGGIEALVKTYQCEVYGPEDISSVTHRLSEPDQLQVSFIDSPVSILNIPGHTLDHIAYYWPGVLFCGDTLFSAGCGRVFEGTMMQMYQSLQKIAALPDDTMIYCTHEYTEQNLVFAQKVEPSNLNIQHHLDKVRSLRASNLPTLPSLLSDEKTFNPFLRCDVPEVVASVEKEVGKKLGSPLEVFTYLREWKNK